MILAIEIALIVIGLMALIRGKWTISKTKVVEGVPARLLGLVALTPIPVAIVASLLYVAVAAPNLNPDQLQKFADDSKWTLVGIEAGIVILTAILVFGIGAAVARDPNARPRDEEFDRYDQYGEPRSDQDRRW
jgi:hypothetical protein